MPQTAERRENAKNESTTTNPENALLVCPLRLGTSLDHRSLSVRLISRGHVQGAKAAQLSEPPVRACRSAEGTTVDILSKLIKKQKQASDHSSQKASPEHSSANAAVMEFLQIHFSPSNQVVSGLQACCSDVIPFALFDRAWRRAFPLREAAATNLRSEMPRKPRKSSLSRA